jgi:hypothetical protein
MLHALPKNMLHCAHLRMQHIGAVFVRCIVKPYFK